MRRLLVACAVTIFSAMPAFADTMPATTPAVPEKKICRVEEVTGSNITETHCHTKTEWAELQKLHDAEIRSLRNGDHWATNGH